MDIALESFDYKGINEAININKIKATLKKKLQDILKRIKEILTKIKSAVSLKKKTADKAAAEKKVDDIAKDMTSGSTPKRVYTPEEVLSAKFKLIGSDFKKKVVPDILRGITYSTKINVFKKEDITKMANTILKSFDMIMTLSVKSIETASHTINSIIESCSNDSFDSEEVDGSAANIIRTAALDDVVAEYIASDYINQDTCSAFDYRSFSQIFPIGLYGLEGKFNRISDKAQEFCDAALHDMFTTNAGLGDTPETEFTKTYNDYIRMMTCLETRLRYVLAYGNRIDNIIVKTNKEVIKAFTEYLKTDEAESALKSAGWYESEVAKGDVYEESFAVIK